MRRRIVPFIISLFAITIISGCYNDSDLPPVPFGGDSAENTMEDGSIEGEGEEAKPLVRYEGPNGLILVAGWAGSAHIMFDMDYFWQLDTALEDAGFDTQAVPVSCFQVHSKRAKEVAAFLYLKVRGVMREMVADGRALSIEEIDPTSIKFNMICHSQGGINARYLVKALSIPDPRRDIPDLDEDALDPSYLDDLKVLAPYIGDIVEVDGADVPTPAPTVPALAASEFIGSIAMLSTPNNGTYIAEWITATAPELIRALAPGIADYLWAGMVNGQRDSNFTAATSRMTRGYMESTFNPALEARGRKTPGINVYVYAAEFKEERFLWWTVPSFIPSFNFAVTGTLWHVIHPVDGSNDGIVPTESALWIPGNSGGDASWINMGVIPSQFGVDHWMIINHFADLTHTDFNYDATPGFDAPAFFIEVAGMLRDAE
jgi:hypothetical protein